MARPKATLEQRKQQRDRIRQAAAEIYRDSGQSAISVRSISERAGVSSGTLYSYFANLEELMQSLWIEPVAAFNRQVEVLVDDHPDPVSRIRVLLEAYVRFAEDEPNVFRGAILFVRPLTAQKPAVEPPDQLPFYRLLRSAIADGQAKQLVRAGDPDTLAQVLWAGIHGALALPINIDRFDIHPQAVLGPEMIDALLLTIAEPSAASH